MLSFTGLQTSTLYAELDRHVPVFREKAARTEKVAEVLDQVFSTYDLQASWLCFFYATVEFGLSLLELSSLLLVIYHIVWLCYLASKAKQKYVLTLKEQVDAHVRRAAVPHALPAYLHEDDSGFLKLWDVSQHSNCLDLLCDS